jgi:hypothetical protein
MERNLSESHWDLDDGDSIDYTQDDCSVEFEQGLVQLEPISDEKLSEALLDIARYRMESYWIGRVME